MLVRVSLGFSGRDFSAVVAYDDYGFWETPEAAEEAISPANDQQTEGEACRQQLDAAHPSDPPTLPTN